MSENNPLTETVPCRECQAGMMRLRFITYFTWLDDELVTVPSFPAWVCDVCGRREYDPRAVNWLSALLNPDAGKPTQKRHMHERPVRRRSVTRPASEQ